MDAPSLKDTEQAASGPGVIQVLVVEDNAGDAFLLDELLLSVTSARFKTTRVDSLAKAVAVLGSVQVDLVLLDLSLPDSFGLDTFERVFEQAHGVPVVVLTGLDDEALAVRAVQKGAQDYLLKGEVTSGLLVRSARYAIERNRLRREIQDALAKIKTLRGLIPICASCKKVRDDKGYWNQVEVYIRDHSEADFTHSICPECKKTLYPQLYADKPSGNDPRDK